MLWKEIVRFEFLFPQKSQPVIVADVHAKVEPTPFLEEKCKCIFPSPLSSNVMKCYPLQFLMVNTQLSDNHHRNNS